MLGNLVLDPKEVNLFSVMHQYTVFCQINALGAEAEDEPLSLSDCDETWFGSL